MNWLTSWLTDLMPPDLSAPGFGSRVDSLIYWVHLLMFALFIGWVLFFLYTLVRFRRSAQPKADYYGVRSHASSYLELAVAVVEGVLLFGLAVPIWDQRVTTDRFDKNPQVLKIRVVAEQFAWNVHYPGPDGKFGKVDLKYLDAQSNPLGLDPNDAEGKDDSTAVGAMALPVGREVLINLTSKDVIHNLFLPHLRVKQDAIPGQTIQVWTAAVKTSAEHKQTEFAKAQAAGKTEWKSPADVPELEIACAQLCGVGHYNMRGTLLLLNEAEFQAWLESKKRG
jgi:cytochrome c oxidase subunit 2